jgi:hypothetical protein
MIAFMSTIEIRYSNNDTEIASFPANSNLFFIANSAWQILVTDSPLESDYGVSLSERTANQVTIDNFYRAAACWCVTKRLSDKGKSDFIPADLSSLRLRILESQESRRKISGVV